MRKEAVEKLVEKNEENWQIVNELVAENKIVETQYGGHTYYMRRFRKRA